MSIEMVVVVVWLAHMAVVMTYAIAEMTHLNGNSALMNVLDTIGLTKVISIYGKYIILPIGYIIVWPIVLLVNRPKKKKYTILGLDLNQILI